MKLIALDTATEACSVALMVDTLVSERCSDTPRGHAGAILPMVDALLAQRGLTLARLDGLAFGRGPGSFTGVRVAAGVAQGLALGAGLPVVAVSDLAALAQAAFAEGEALAIACMDARMGQVYWCAYERDARGGSRALCAEQLSGPEAVTLPCTGKWAGVGSGFAAFPRLAERLALDTCDPGMLPRARHMLGLAAAELAAGRGLGAAEALPVYLRDAVVRPPRGRA